MKTGKTIVVLLLMASIFTGSVYSQETIIIRIGYLAPERSPWFESFKKAKWELAKRTGGRVKLKIYPGAIAGSGPEMVEKLRSGKLDGVVISQRGIGHIYPDINVVSVIGLFKSEKEFYYVFNKMKPFFEKEIEKKGFKVIALGPVGWCRIFSKNPVFYPEDLKKHTLPSFSPHNPELEQTLKDAGYRLVPIDETNFMEKLKSGELSALILPPYAAAVTQLHTYIPNMYSQKTIPTIAGFLIRKKSWDDIPARYQKLITKKYAQIDYDRAYQKVEKIEKEAIEKMVENDLIVNKLPRDALEKWADESRRWSKKWIWKTFSGEVLVRLWKHLIEYRAKHSHQVQ